MARWITRWIVGALTLVVALAFTPVLSAPAQAGQVPSQAQWRADVRKAMDGSLSYVGRRVDRGGRRLAVNLDIDNTSLATYYDRGHAVPAVLRFARYARSHGVTLLFNTGRRQNRLKAVTRDLRRAGYAVTEVCGRRAGESLTHSKQRCRRHFVGKGYTIIANVGNRSTDFVGGNYERGYRLPSYGNRLG